MFVRSPNSNASRPKKESIEKKRMRTPSPSKNQRQFSDDAYSPNDIGEATPRPDGFARSAYPIPNLSYIEALANEPIEYGDDLQALAIFQPLGQSQEDYFFMERWKWGDIHTLGETRSPRNENNCGGNGLALLEKQEEVGDGPVVAAKLKQRLAEADAGKMKRE
ncbi:hypothetical protein PMIN01_11814 [Paraphaeosphaeria minitans]|uniref:Uncharacterized protein n=1 Tax=Paraphaeosphaeria minitans TaxID=565426 RepID=A0A9P6KKS1_9PLEO|nr:hypothetical protein PMIN01_11814 [Paraphaeosphaeria minitans]